MGKTQKVKGLRLAFPTLLSITAGEPPALDQPRFIGMQGQVELLKAFPQFSQEPYGLVAVLKPQDEVVRVPHDDDVAGGELLTPPVDPKVEDVAGAWPMF